MKSYMIIPTQGGSPVIDSEKTPIHGYVLCAPMKGNSLYLVSGTQAQLDALAKAAVQVVQVSETEGEKWPELKVPLVVTPVLSAFLATAKEAAVDTKLSAGENLKALAQKYSPAFTIEGTDVDAPKDDVKPVGEIVK